MKSLPPFHHIHKGLMKICRHKNTQKCKPDRSRNKVYGKNEGANDTVTDF